MNDLISRKVTIDDIETVNPSMPLNVNWVKNWVKTLPSAQPKPDEWCTDCKEYDSEKHCCPRFNRVIRNALKDAQPEVIRCGGCKHHEDEELGMVYCPIIVGNWVRDDWFCADAERREE